MQVLDTKQIILDYYNELEKGFKTGRLDLTKLHLADSIQVIGPNERFEGKEVVEPMLGCFVSCVSHCEIKKQYTDADSACTVIDFVTKTGVVIPTIEWIHVKEGKIVEIRPVYDTVTWEKAVFGNPFLSHVKFVSIPVKDQDKALKFYQEKLGFQLIKDAPVSETSTQRWIELKMPGAQTQVVLFTPQGQEDRVGTFSNIVFTSENVEKTYEELKSRGVEFLQPPTRESWGTYTILKDLDGNTFCFSSS